MRAGRTMNFWHGAVCANCRTAGLPNCRTAELPNCRTAYIYIYIYIYFIFIYPRNPSPLCPPTTSALNTDIKHVMWSA